MKKLGLVFKETSENRIKVSLKNSNSFFIVKYSGLSGPELNALRQSLRGANAEFLVVRNNVARRCLKDYGNEELLNLVSGPVGMIFTKDEPVSPSKILYNFSKDHENLKLEGGLLEQKLIKKSDIESLAKLPSREVLILQTVCGLKAPITGLVMVLKGNLRKLVFCLEQIKQKKPS